MFIAAIIMLGACSSKRDFVKNPLDTLIKELDTVSNFTVILYDMDEEGTFSKKYKHMYKIVTEDKEGKPDSKTTAWQPVSEEFFFQHESDMGMEIASKLDGKVTKQTSPPGYSRYVGNERYGSWQSGSDGSSFWAFYGQYAFMSSMLGLATGPIYRRSYTDYHTNYRSVGRPYYGGTSTSPAYGTYSSTALKQNPKSNFASKVQSRTSSSTSSGATRSGSRYSSSSSSRSSSSSSSRGGK